MIILEKTANKAYFFNEKLESKEKENKTVLVFTDD